MRRRKSYIVAIVLLICLGMSSCLSDDNFEDLKVEEVGSDSEVTATGNDEEGGGANPPP